MRVHGYESVFFCVVLVSKLSFALLAYKSVLCLGNYSLNDAVKGKPSVKAIARASNAGGVCTALYSVL